MMLAAATSASARAIGRRDQVPLRTVLVFPDGHFLAYLVSLGYPRTAAPAAQSGSTGDRSTRSCTVAAGSARRAREQQAAATRRS